MFLLPFTAIWKTDIKEQKSTKFLVPRVKSFGEYQKLLFLDRTFHFNVSNVLQIFLFNIYLKFLIQLAEKISNCNFVDDVTFHACDSSLDSLVKWVEYDSNLGIECFDSNYMKLNQDKCHLKILVVSLKLSGLRLRIDNFWNTGNKSFWELS